MPMVTQNALNAGFYPGGEGCQYPQMIAIDATDGSFILYGTDVGGMYRSVDGGQKFQPCNTGVQTAGAVGFAIDPRNRNRCLAVGDGGGNALNIYGGVYLSTNRGASWTSQLSKWLDANGYGYWWSSHGREQIAYDPSSYNAGVGYCTVAYWVEEGNPQEAGGNLYKTANGGVFWSLVGTPGAYGGADNAHSLVKVHPTLGYVYIANANGFYRSTNGGASFTQILAGNFMSLDVVPSAPDTVWTALAGTNRIYKSTDKGATFTATTASGILNILALKASPANTNYMLASDAARNNQRYYSTNGGANWYATGKGMSLSWIPSSILYDDRNTAHVWHPTNAAVARCIGPGDIMSATTNKGVTLTWANNGNNGIMLGGGFNFNTQNPNLMYFGSQDYNGARTTNGGITWDFVNLSISNTDGDPWGWVYGAYTADSRTMFGGNKAYQASTYELWITFDGGASSSRKVSNLTGLETCYGDPSNTNVLFCWSYRSADHGTNWSQMTGCQGVFTHNPADNTLYGANGTKVVKSTDKGATWTTVVTMSANVVDVAINPSSGRLWIVTAGALWRWDSGSPVSVSQPNGNASSVAVDPQNPLIIYVAGTAGTWRLSGSTVVRSQDNGFTWESLNNRSDLGYDGANCASWCRVHPSTRELWVGTVCYGMWRLGSRPAITNQPLAQTVSAGQNATFTVGASGSGPLFYQWSLNGTNVPGATASTYTRTNVQPSDAGSYSVVVNNIAASVGSSNAVLTVNVPPAITTQPQSVSATVGSNVVFTVVATGTGPLSYQWLVNSNVISGATATTLLKGNVQTNDAGVYSVVVSNLAGVVASTDALLTVTLPVPHVDAITVLSDGSVLLQCGGNPGYYGIDATTNLLDWEGLTNFTTTATSFSYIDGQTNFLQRFYRIWLRPE